MSTATVKPKAMIQDNTRCIGCRACMVACKSWNERPADHTDFFAGAGYQNPRDLDANNYTLICTATPGSGPSRNSKCTRRSETNSPPTTLLV